MSCVVVVGEDAAGPAVGEIEGAAIEAEARPVADDDPAVEPGDGQVGIKAVQAAKRILLLVVHVAGDEAALPVDLAVVEPGAQDLPLGIGDRAACAGREVEQMEAIAQRDHGAALLAQAHRADMLGHAPALDPCAARIAALDQLAVAVDPVEPLLLNVPQGTFAEIVPGIDQQLDPQHVPAPRSAAPAAGSRHSSRASLTTARAWRAMAVWPPGSCGLDLEQVQLAFGTEVVGTGDDPCADRRRRRCSTSASAPISGAAIATRAHRSPAAANRSASISSAGCAREAGSPLMMKVGTPET